MRLSKSFGKTLREKPSEAEVPSHSLMIRAGLICKLAAGIYSYMPFAWRSIKKIKDIMGEEMNAIGGQELCMPVVNPADIWIESGRWYEIGPEMARFKDRSGRDMCLAMTHEEAVTDLARHFIDSYKQLPSVVYHIQTKFRDEPRCRGGLIRVREFIMKDAYSFHVDEGDLRSYYPYMCQAYERICKRCGVPVVKVLSDVGMMGGDIAHEFTYVTDSGEDTIILCDQCGYAANRDVAKFDKTATTQEPDGEGKESLSSPEEVHTPSKNTIESVCDYLGVSPTTSLKTMVYFAQDREDPVLVVIRGDLDVNERKLANLLNAAEVRRALPDELKSYGLIQGFLSPMGDHGLYVVADDSVLTSRTYVAGANKPDYHMIGVVPGRDFKIDVTADIAAARANDPCAVCGAPLTVKKGIEVGNTFMLGTRYSETMGAYFQSEKGTLEPIVMGCYGMGVGRLLACVVEENHDEHGIIWPITVAPYQVHLLNLGTSEKVIDTTDKVYTALLQNGIEVLYDDRDESAGVKFNDADLLGMPVRITISNRSLESGGAEVKLRRESDTHICGIDELVEKIKEILEREAHRYVAD
ncbi:MAG TPA: proline--tRNA ligase [Bacillota bacterium]|nr:proline--tRNA ligase [Candidatus Fermentithermobacillaceae bacterium]HOB30020.1 proline--tRNA ligase [Bacillota bacterium]HOK63910.1 proline--tRNA ligase [Bacillota bacterium]HOL11265.1 proline--tRNA ligase [Bacillota bacterium]HOQ02394.1 proline--tRNA ligase [Bacillota bacterium]